MQVELEKMKAEAEANAKANAEEITEAWDEDPEDVTTASLDEEKPENEND